VLLCATPRDPPFVRDYLIFTSDLNEKLHPLPSLDWKDLLFFRLNIVFPFPFRTIIAWVSQGFYDCLFLLLALCPEGTFPLVQLYCFSFILFGRIGQYSVGFASSFQPQKAFWNLFFFFSQMFL